MGKIKYNRGDKVVFIDEHESKSYFTPDLYQVCTIVMEFEVDHRIGEEEDRVIAIEECPNIVFRHNQLISLVEFRKQKIEKCLKGVIK
jgi:hypothetical protein